MITCLVLAACAASPTALSPKPSSTTKAPATLPGEARILRSLDVTLPAVSQVPSTLPGADQRDVVFVDAHTGFLATGGEEIGTNQGGVYNPSSGGIQRTIDAGKTWQTVWSEPGADISTVMFVSRSIGFAAGRIFPTDSATSASGAPAWLRTTNGGASWTVTTPALPNNASDAWPALRFAAATPGIILGAPNPNNDGGFTSLLLRSGDSGAHWAQVGPSGWASSGGIAFASPSIAFASGFMATPGAATAGTRLWTSHDSGLTWKAVPGTDLPFGLLALDFPDPTHGYAAGGNLAKYEMRPSRALLATSDGGRSWSLRYRSPDGDVSNPISQLHFIDSNRGWASIGSCSEGQNGPCGGPVLLTTDGGSSWHTTGRNAIDISPVSSNEAWALDGRFNGFIWHSVDAGANWAPVVRPGALAINSLAGARGWLVATTAAGSWQSTDNGASWLAFDPPMLAGSQQDGSAAPVAQPPGLLVVTGDVGLRVSHDAGGHVADVTLPGQDPNSSSQIAAAFSDSAHGVAVVGAETCVKPPGYIGPDSGKPVVGVPSGNATVAVTTDGGTTWTARGSLNIMPWGVGAAPTLWAIAGSTACGPPRQVLLTSRDEGSHWAMQGLPTFCDALGVAAAETIWLGCADSLLISQDGAATWTRYRFPSGPPSFLLTGSSEAWAFGPAGALWHTTTGGRTWSAIPLSF